MIIVKIIKKCPHNKFDKNRNYDILVALSLLDKNDWSLLPKRDANNNRLNFYNRLLKKDLWCLNNVIVKRLESFFCFFSPKETLLD